MNWTCRYCGKDTSDIDYDYLDGYDHLACALINNIKVKTKLKIENPHHINTKNYMKDGSIIEIVYLGHEMAINAADNEKYTKYKFKGEINTKYNDILFEIHTKIKNNNVQFNVWKGATMAVSGISIDIIRDRDALINYMINEIKKL